MGCGTSADCYAGLGCQSGTCQPVPPGLPSFGVPSFAGAVCDPAPAGEPVRALFAVPGAEGSPLGADFFSLPFPNDARLSAGAPDLSGFPLPGSDVLGFDPVARTVDALERSARGWGAYPTVIFRFSGPILFSSLAPSSGPSRMRWIDVTPGAVELGADAGWRAVYDASRTKYICPCWLALRRHIGSPLLPGHTYAVWLTTEAHAENGTAIERPPELASLLAPAAPTDPVLAAVYDRYGPLRSYLAGANLDPATILNATVFTVGDVLAPMRDLAAEVASGSAPTAHSWVRCGAGVTSPCPQAEGDRACGGSNPDYDEYHALVGLPIFQAGTPPYTESGGGIAPSVVRTEDVCLALSVPRATMPANGWPLVIFAHGTGGSFRSHLRPEVAGALAHVTTSAGDVRLAVLGIDQVEHGPRRGSSDASPNDLFFNFSNLDAARGNPLQGAADQLSLARFASALTLDAATSGGDAIRIDPGAIVFFGHSQGSTHGSLALPFADQVRAAVLSGNGASIGDSLVSKTSPVNIAASLPMLLGGDSEWDDPSALRAESFHPVLSLVSQWIDPADPLHFARLAARSPEASRTPKHLLQTYGLGDTYSPTVTLRQYALAAGLDQAPPDPSAAPADDLGIPPRTTAVQGNLTVGTGSFTLVVRQYGPPAGADGHFVAFDQPNANQDVVGFLALAAMGQVPSVGQ
jgi:hypothetical protein